MGLFKVLVGVGLGVGAVAAAPFTGGGSIFGAASLAGSLAGAGMAATAAGAAGGAVGAIASAVESDEEESRARRAREAGFEDGIRKGNIEAAKRFADILEKDELHRQGIFALAISVAALDGINEDEIAEIEGILGRPDSLVNKKISAQLQSIYDEKPCFFDVKMRYLNKFSASEIAELNEVISIMVNADSVISAQEKKFLETEWAPYVADRKKRG